MTYVRVAEDAAARWRLVLPALAGALVVAAPGLRLWPFLGAVVIFGFWTGFAAGGYQGRTWRHSIERTLGSGAAADVDIESARASRLPRGAATVAVAVLILAATHAAGGLTFAIVCSCVAAFGGWSFGRGTAVGSIERERGWHLHWPAGSNDRPGLPRLVAVQAAPAGRRPGLFAWALPLALVASVLAMGLAVETFAAVRSLATGPLPTIAAPSARSHIDPNLGRVASEVAGRAVEVRCWSAADWPRVTVLDPVEAGGFADLAARTVNLPPDVCGSLAALAYGPAHRFADATWEQIAAPHVLAHEAGHLGDAGTSESRAECDAVQTTQRTAELLGADAAYARWMAALDWSHLYPRLPGSYRTADCVPGGPLDLHLAEGWPAATPAAP